MTEERLEEIMQEIKCRQRILAESHSPMLGAKRDKNPITKSGEIKHFKQDRRKHYVFHCNETIGLIFEGSEMECRAYMMRNNSPIRYNFICDEEEYIMLKNMSEENVRAYFKALEEIAYSR